MSMAQSLIAEIEREGEITREHLRVVPEDQLGWKPHEKSMSMGHLASHIAEILSWTGSTVREDEIDIDMETYEPFQASSTEELLKAFDANLAGATEAVKAASDGDLMKPWTMKVKGEPRFTMPKAAVLRGFIISHMIHHRGQLSVYLRLKDVPVPVSYGNTADFPEM